MGSTTWLRFVHERKPAFARRSEALLFIFGFGISTVLALRGTVGRSISAPVRCGSLGCRRTKRGARRTHSAKASGGRFHDDRRVLSNTKRCSQSNHKNFVARLEQADSCRIRFPPNSSVRHCSCRRTPTSFWRPSAKQQFHRRQPVSGIDTRCPSPSAKLISLASAAQHLSRQASYQTCRRKRSSPHHFRTGRRLFSSANRAQITLLAYCRRPHQTSTSSTLVTTAASRPASMWRKKRLFFTTRTSSPY